MCELYNLDHITNLREVEMYCNDFSKKIGLPHNLSAIVTDTNYCIHQCAERIFSSIQIKNVYFKIVQDYVRIQHDRFGCGVKTFVVMLGCFLHYLIILLEEKLSKEYIIQGIQEGIDILIHLYRKAGKRCQDRHNFKGEKLFVNETTTFLKNKISKYMHISLPQSKEDQLDHEFSKYVQSKVYGLCHYESVDMKNTLWLIIKGILLPECSQEPTLEANQELNPIKSIGVILSQTFNSSGLTEFNSTTLKMKEDMQNIITLTSTHHVSNDIGNFSIHSGILVNISLDVGRILNKFTGLKTCLIFLCDINVNIWDNQCNIPTVLYNMEMNQETETKYWTTELLSKIKMVQTNCLLLSGKCDGSFLNECVSNLDIAIIESVSPKILDIISSIMNINMIYDINSMFNPCQLVIDTIPGTQFEKSVLCSIQIPQWMKIFGVTSEDLKTVVINHPSMEMAEVLCESFNHNLKRIENCLSIGYSLEGGGSLEKKFAAELRARANNIIINNSGIESIDVKCKAFLALTNGLELFHLNLKSNLSKLEIESNDDMMIDDLESKVGCFELLSECLTNILSTNLMIFKSNLNTTVQ